MGAALFARTNRWRKLALTGVVAVVLGLNVVSPQAVLAYNDPLPPGTSTVGLWTHVQRGGTNQCLDDSNFSVSWGNRMQLWGCGGNSNQQWRVLIGQAPSYLLDNAVILQNMTSGLCLDVWQRSGANFTPAVQWPCSFNDPAQWIETPFNYAWYTGSPLGAFEVQSAGVGTCLDDPYGQTANGTKLEFYSCNQTVAQAWMPQNTSPSWVGLVPPYVYNPWITGPR